MSKDLFEILKDWDYEPEQVTVRIIEGSDQRKKIQLRVDLGVLQMEMDGRPDGQRPEGYESWLDCYEEKQRLHDEQNPDSAPFHLGDDDCACLWREAVQYYHRYLSFWHLDLYDLCVRDTARNLRLFAFAREHAQKERHKLQFDQWRPYVLMMHTRAVATPLLAEKQSAEALQAVEAGIDAIRDFLEEYNQTDRAEECIELVGLERWRDELLAEKDEADAKRPRTKIESLREQLEAAVAAEQFEEAARLRDQIREFTREDKTKLS